MYVSNDTKQKIINRQDTMLDEMSAKYTKEVYARMVAQTGEIVENKKKKRWRDIALVAGFLAIFGLTR
jgi:ferritin-like metal-binding protein YciE